MAVDVSGTVAVARWWWTFILRGLIAVAFGVVAFFAPLLGLVALVALFAAWALVDGVTSLFTGIRTREQDRHWWVEILEGIVGVVAGVIALLFPIFAADVLILLIGVWAILTGLFEIYMAIRLREQIQGEFWLGLAGLASILFGVLIIVFPGTGAMSVAWLIASFSVVFGAFLIILGWRLRRVDELARIDAEHDYSR